MVGHVQRRYKGLTDNYDSYPKAMNIITSEGEPLIHFPYLTYRKFTGTLYLVEDIPSAEAINKYACAAALLGTNLTDAVVSKLLSIGVTDLRVCLDEDAQATAAKLRRRWSLLFERMSVVFVDKDPKDMTEEELHDYFKGDSA